MYKEPKESLGVTLNIGEFDGNVMQKRIHITKERVGSPEKVLDVGRSGGWLPKFCFIDKKTRVWGLTNNDAESASIKRLPFKSGDLVLLVGSDRTHALS